MKTIKGATLLKAGDHIDSNNNPTPISKADIAELAGTYDKSNHEAFVLIGHSSDPLMGECPHDRCPSYGWVDKAYADGDTLKGDLEVTDELYDWLDKGYYKYKSLGIYPRDLEINPDKGKLSIRHLAILGAQPPAIKGLGPLIEYNETTMPKKILTKAEKDDFQLESETDIGGLDADDAVEDQQITEDQSKGPKVKNFDGADPVEFNENVEETETGTFEDLDPEIAGFVDENLNRLEGAELEEFLDDNTEGLYRFVLQDGLRGYKGEITEFDPVPSFDNGYLYNDELEEITGEFVDDSLTVSERFTFRIRKDGDGWISEYKPVEAETEETSSDEAEQELREDPEEAATTEFGEGCGCGPAPAMGAMVNAANGSLDQIVAMRGMKMKKMEKRMVELEEKLAMMEATMVDKLMEVAYGENRILPTQLGEDVFRGFCEALTKQGGSTLFSFAEGAPQKTLLEQFSELIAQLPPQVQLGALEDQLEPSESTASIRAYAEMGARADVDDMRQTREAVRTYCEANNLDVNNHRHYIQALKKVSTR
jgi:hypothetical protein